MNKYPITIGCDPELFLIDAAGKPVSPIGKVGGTKDHPRIIDEKHGIGVLEDGVTVEFNLPPKMSANDLLGAVDVAVGLINNRVAIPLGCGVHVGSSMVFEPHQLDSPQAMISGCVADYDAYKRGEMRMPMDFSTLGNVRCAGGHIHLGYDVKNAKTPPWAIVQMLDAFALMFWGNHWDGDKVRRTFYGLPGVYRPKPYGLEYRTPNPQWVRGGGSDCDFVNACQSVVAGIMADEHAARKAWGAIDWKAVYSYLSQPSHSSNKFGAARDTVITLKAEMLAKGQEYLEQMWEEQETNSINPRRGGFHDAMRAPDMLAGAR